VWTEVRSRRFQTSKADENNRGVRQLWPGCAAIPSTFGMAVLGFICSDCSNYVAVLYGNQFANPRAVLDVKWSPTVVGRGEAVFSSERQFVVCRTARDFLVLKELQAIVKEEDQPLPLCSPEGALRGTPAGGEKTKVLRFSSLDRRQVCGAAANLCRGRRAEKGPRGKHGAILGRTIRGRVA
jgi:hypothetical protein